MRPPTKASTIFHLFLCTIFYFFCVSVTTAKAAPPVVDSVSGELADGQSIAITGTSFGNDGPNVIVFDDFESGTPGDPINTGAGSATYGQWGSLEGDTFYDTSAVVSGSQSFTATFADNYRNFVQADLPAGNRNTFISWWQFLPSDDNWPGEGTVDGINWKVIWMMGLDTVTDDMYIPGILATSKVVSGNEDDPDYGNWVSSIPIVKGEWIRQWVWFKGSTTSTSADGDVKYWYLSDSQVVQVLNDIGVNNLKETGSWTKVRANGYGRVTPNCEPSFDDIYIAAGPNAQARVEIGNAPTYAASTKLTILTPTSWSDSTISATVNVGSFDPDETAYLFVVDKNGNVSDGYPVTFLSDPAASNQPPVAVASSDITSGTAPLTVNFDGSASTDSDGTIVSYSWEFGDGNTGTGSTAANVYLTAGNYTATLTVTDNESATGSDTVAITVTPQNSSDIYDNFNTFCIESFGAEKEELIYDSQGDVLTEVVTGAWAYASRNSATIAWETNLPSVSYVEFGLTTSYGQTTDSEERPFYHHVHIMTGLTAGVTYHYRLVSIDERGNTLTSEDRTITTELMASAIELPGSMGATPFWLDQDGATYILTQDIIADSTAFNIQGENITIDLNGYTVTYDSVNSAEDDTSSSTYWAGLGPHAVRRGYSASINLYNGRIVQGDGQTAGTVPDSDEYDNAIAQPIYGATEVAGVIIDYASAQNSGMTSANHVHHCVITDQGSDINNRHIGVSAIAQANNVHHNLIKRARHKGISSSTQVSHNELYMDSQATNSIGFGVNADQTYEYNKIFGTGYHVVAIGWNLNDTDNVTIRHNLVHLVGKDPEPIWAEYGDQISLNGIRLTQYAGATDVYRNWLYEDNIISIYVKGSAYLDDEWIACQGRGIQLASDPTVYDFVVRNNIIKVLADENDPHITNASCVVTQGLSDRMETAEPIYFRDNNFISNFTNVRFGDYYTSGSNYHFEDCTFIKTGNDSRYHTFYGGYWTQNSARHWVLDGIFQGGAALDSIAWEGSGTRNYTVGWTLDLTTSPGATVTVKDSFEQIEYEGTADASGKAYPVLAQYFMQPDDLSNQNVAENRNPHTVYVELNDLASSDNISVTQIGQIMTLYPDSTPNQPPVAVASADPISGTAPLTVNFDGTASTDSDGTIESYSWNFGDGNTATGLTVANTYQTAGNYTATLTVTDNESATGSDTVAIFATGITPTETIEFMEGGGDGTVDVDFDDTYIVYNPASNETYGNYDYNGIRCDSSRATLIGIKEMFTELPKTLDSTDIIIESASLYITRYLGDSGNTISVYPATTNWLNDTAGTNEDNVSGQNAEVSSSTSWASGDFSLSDYDSSVVSTGSWVGGYNEVAEIDVTDVIAKIYADEVNYGMVLFADDSITGRASENLTGKPSLKITYHYGAVPPVPGDIDQDGDVDLTDAILGLQIATGSTPETISPDGDVDGDGKIGIEEVIYILQSVQDE